MAGASFSELNLVPPFVVQEAQTRSLHFTFGEVQSSMNLERPDELQVDYTRTMMGFLLLNPQPQRIAMIGLGGGSLVKFCHRYLPTARMTVAENNPGVVALRGEFGIPGDDDRLSVRQEDGAVFMAGLSGDMDVLLVDGFDERGQPPQLCSQAFYDSCFRALAPGGLLVVNLHVDHPEHDLHIERIDSAFGGNAMQVLAREKANCIVLAGRRRPVSIEGLRSRQWSRSLDPAAQAQLRGEFARIGWSACAMGAGRRQPGNGLAA